MDASAWFSPGPLVVGSRRPDRPFVFRFHPLGDRARFEPRHEIVERWFCPHGAHGGEPLQVRRYPDLDEPAMFVDCSDCRITWELPYAPEPVGFAPIEAADEPPESP